MAFGPNSTNPREKRAYAHTKLAQLRNGEASYEDAFAAVKVASHNRKGQSSGFSESLGKAAVLVVDWGATSFQNLGIVHHNFGGYLMQQSETHHWTALRSAIVARLAALGPRDHYGPDDPTLRDLYNQHNQIHDAGYPMAKFTRIFKGEPTMVNSFPSPGTVVNPAKLQDVTPFIGWNESEVVEARIAELQK